MIKDEQKKEEIKRQYELKLKKQKRKELITVLAILSSVFVQALLIGLIKGGAGMVQDITGGSLAQAKEIYENTKTALIGIGIISLIIMLIFIVQCIKGRKKSRHAKNINAKKAFIDYDRLEIARLRVAKARMEEKHGKRSGTGLDDRMSRLDALEKEDAEYLSRHRQRTYHGMSESEYKKLLKEEYERYMNMDFSEDVNEKGLYEEDMDEYQYGYEEYTRLDKIKAFIKRNIMIIAIASGVIVLAVMAVIIISIL